MGRDARYLPEVDAYIAGAPEYARPVLAKIREAFHAGCPELEERIKWGVPSFEHRGMMAGMAAFKRYVSIGFWKSRLMEDFDRVFNGQPRASMMGARIESLEDLPPKKVLIAYVKEAKRLNDEDVKEPKPARPKRAIRVTVPADLKAALGKNRKASEAFASLPPSHKREYIEWITEAKRDETRARRLKTAVEWIGEGKRRNWKYERS